MSDYNLIEHTGTSIPLVSVAMLTYGHEAYIVQAIESVLMQKTDFMFELVIAHDHSPDNTEKILLDYQKKYPSIIKLILQRVNVGAARNNADLFDNLKGKYIAALEGDDYWTDPLKLQRQVDVLESNEQIVLCGTNFHSFKDGSSSLKKEQVCEIEELISFEDLIKANRIGTLTALFRNQNISEWRAFHKLAQEQQFKMGDYAIWLSITEGGGLIKLLPEFTANYRILPNSASNFSDAGKKLGFAKNVLDIQLYFVNKYRTSDLGLKRAIYYSALSSFYFHGYFSLFNDLYKQLKTSDVPIPVSLSLKRLFLKFRVLRKMHLFIVK